MFCVLVGFCPHGWQIVIRLDYVFKFDWCRGRRNECRNKIRIEPVNFFLFRSRGGRGGESGGERGGEVGGGEFAGLVLPQQTLHTSLDAKDATELIR
jgi:uncharacterized membrane protein YgcG